MAGLNLLSFFIRRKRSAPEEHPAETPQRGWYKLLYRSEPFRQWQTTAGLDRAPQRPADARLLPQVQRSATAPRPCSSEVGW
jgi:hypothetical protein